MGTMHDEPHITVRPVYTGTRSDDTRFEVDELPVRGDDVPERTYARLDAAVSKAWTLSKRRGVPLILSIHPGRPHELARPTPQEDHS